MIQARPCGSQQARDRLRKALDFLEVAQAALDRNKFDPAASDAVLAGIAAADALCCLLLQRHAAGADHGAAAALLSKVDPMAGAALRRLLSMKYKAQYDERSATPAEARDAVKRAQRLVERAVRAVAAG